MRWSEEAMLEEWQYLNRLPEYDPSRLPAERIPTESHGFTCRLCGRESRSFSPTQLYCTACHRRRKAK